MAGLGLAEVVESCSASFQPGDLVCAETGWQTFAVVPAAGLIRLPRLEPLTHLLSVYGVAGLTAYFGLLECVRPVQGETLAVSAAAGAVGSIVGQIARIRGCRTVGIAGGASKCAWLVRELGFDAALDYKTGTLADDLRRTCPDGIDAYFDNTGGAILDACLPNMAEHGRVACCGAISQYDLDRPAAGPAGIPGLLIIKRLTLRGFLLGDFLEQRAGALRSQGMGRLRADQGIRGCALRTGKPAGGSGRPVEWRELRQAHREGSLSVVRDQRSSRWRWGALCLLQVSGSVFVPSENSPCGRGNEKIYHFPAAVPRR